MSDENPHDQLIADLGSIGIVEAELVKQVDLSQHCQSPTSHPKLGAVEFLDSISVDGDLGVTGTYDSKTYYIRKLKVKNGIVVELEIEPLEV